MSVPIMSITHIASTLKAQLSGNHRLARLAGMCISGGLLAACAQQPTLYSWDSYQPAAYAYLQGDEDPAAEVQAMEKNIETARAHDKALPPGFHAHLGLLYLQQGQDARAMEQIQSERAAFPESTTFMDFLLRQNKDAPTSPANEQQASTAAPPHSAESTAKQPS